MKRLLIEALEMSCVVLVLICVVVFSISAITAHGDCLDYNLRGGTYISAYPDQYDREYYLSNPMPIVDENGLEYDFYRSSCPKAERMVRLIVRRFVSQQHNVPAQLLRLLFHDCFIKGCDASLLLKIDGSRHVERDATPNKTVKGFEIIEAIKEEIEKVCPGIVSCSDILVLATRDAIVMTGSPYYPLTTGRRDSDRSFYTETDDIPRPNAHIKEILNLFSVRGFNELETVALLGAHNIGEMSCDFVETRRNIDGLGKQDPSLPPEFAEELNIRCSNKSNSIPSGFGFDSHFYRALVRGRALIFSDQQLMTNEITARIVTHYASDDGTTFRMEFARAMLKLSNLHVLTGSNGQVRRNCSVPN